MKKVGQTGKRIKMLQSCTIRKLRRKVKERMEVEPERQVLIYNGQVLVDERPETKEEMILSEIVEFKGNVTSTHSISGTLWAFCQQYFL